MMVAYSFKERFAQPIVAGTKLQTIRAHRARHARPGEQFQLYTGMRTKQCRLIALKTCIAVHRILLQFSPSGVFCAGADIEATTPRELDEFARKDGFSNFDDLERFWSIEHQQVLTFDGMVIFWE